MRMWKNMLTASYRFLKQHKLYALLNLSGLAIGIACTIFIMLWVMDELSYDRHFRNSQNIFRLVYTEELQSGTFRSAAVPAPYGPAFKEIIPGVDDFFRVKPYTRGKVVACRDDKYTEKNLLYADPSILRILDFDFIGGDTNSLNGPNDVILTQSTARKYFGSEDPLGKILLLDDTIALKVNGVIKNLPPNTHLRFDLLLNFGRLALSGWKTGWYNRYYFTYFLLGDNARPQEISDRLCSMLAGYMNTGQNTGITADLLPRLYLQPLKDVHLRSDFDIDLYGASHSGIRQVYFFSVIGLLILMICAINYTNLTVACYSGRNSETGIRKILGATRRRLMSRYLAEALAFSVVAFLTGLMIFQLLLPSFNAFTGKNLVFHFLDGRMAAGAILTILFTGLLAGAYPALFISSVPAGRAQQALKTGKASGFRKALVITQFAAGALLITGTLTVKRQLSYIRNKNLGLNRENVFFFRATEALQSKYAVFDQELQKYTGIRNVTSASALPTHTVHSTEARYGRDGSKIVINHETVDPNYLEAMDIRLVSGRNFEKNSAADSSNFIVNQAAARMMGIEDPVGEPFELSGRKGRIIGVMQDFNFKSLFHKIEPLVYHQGRRRGPYILVRLKGENLQEEIATLKKVYAQIDPATPFDFTMLQTEYDSLYRTEDQTRILFSIFSIIALFLAFLGFFGLSSFMARQKTREIAIRKTFGATTAQIAKMLTWNFTRWIIAANIIAIPVAWLIMNDWLDKFAYRISIGPAEFAFAMVVSVLVAWASQLYQIRKTARKNPVDALKYE